MLALKQSGVKCKAIRCYFWKALFPAKPVYKTEVSSSGNLPTSKTTRREYRMLFMKMKFNNRRTLFFRIHIWQVVASLGNPSVITM